MRVQVKICGINSPEAFDAAVAAGVEWLGFACIPASPRYVTAQQAAALSGRSPGGPGRVALLIDPADAEVAAVMEALHPDVLQLHQVDVARAAAIRSGFGVKVWLATGIATRDDLPAAAPGVDGLLLDAKPAPNATLPGGNAVPFDWSVLRGWQAPVPWILAGGLTPENVAHAIRTTGAAAVDVSSGVESRRGVKDAARIAAFADAVHRETAA